MEDRCCANRVGQLRIVRRAQLAVKPALAPGALGHRCDRIAIDLFGKVAAGAAHERSGETIEGAAETGRLGERRERLIAESRDVGFS